MSLACLSIVMVDPAQHFPGPRTSDFAALAADVLACRACEHAGYLASANPIRPVCTGRERIVIIGQAPGPVTDLKGYHFAGPAGSVLDGWFQRAGFQPGAFREIAYLTSLTRCFPGKSATGNGDRPPGRRERELCRPFLDREHGLFHPALVVLVGKMAIDTFLEKQPLERTIGRAHEHDGQLFLPLPHASGVSRWLNDPAHRALLDHAIGELDHLRRTLHLDDETAASAKAGPLAR